MAKTLSNGVMSLRFMQNAQRAKQQAEVELEQAKIRDEAEWEVSQDVKDAWGIGLSSGTRFVPASTSGSYTDLPGLHVWPVRRRQCMNPRTCRLSLRLRLKERRRSRKQSLKAGDHSIRRERR